MSAEFMYRYLTRKLHELDACGLDDSAEAEELRSDSDALWPRLDDAARRRLGEYSERLYQSRGQ